MTPSYLRVTLPLTRRLLYRLGNTNTFHAIRCKTSRYMNSFFPDVINSWNNIITNFHNLPRFTSLKAHIRPKIKNTFGVHDPLGLRYLFQLRVKLSPLRNHKKHHNFSYTPSEICECNQGIEDTCHFLFECPRYGRHGATLAARVIEILQRNNLNHQGNLTGLYLYGHKSLKLTDNKIILLSTIKYIKDTQPFSV